MNPNRWRQAIATATASLFAGKPPRFSGLRHHHSLYITRILGAVSFTQGGPPLAMTSWIGNRSPCSGNQKRFFSSQANPMTTTRIDSQENGDTISSESTLTAAAKNNNTIRNGKKKTASRSWDDHLRDLTAFRQTEGHTRVPLQFPQNPSLAYFVRRQRRYPDKLTQKQRDQLVALGFSWETRAERLDRQWADKVRELLDYGSRHEGDLSVPRKYDINPALGLWVNRQRSLQRQGQLPEDRQKKLEDIGFSWRHGGKLAPSSTKRSTNRTATHDRKWLRQYAKLVAYHLEKGDCLVPARYDQDESLGHWVVAQRSLHRKGLLKIERVQLLNALLFVYDPK